ncbi:N-glycosylase/DNA lyase [Candidatus Woesearchaeota archaeon]|nr:N-glycosylase/DNA lyase [Candidatus Woesearchaeota archaeon]
MKSLIRKINALRKTEIKKRIDSRLKEFESFKVKNNKAWFSELCFCILTANSKAKTAIAIQKELGIKGFCSGCAADVKACIIKNKHRFHNNKTSYIIQAREHLNIKSKLKSKSEFEAREWLASNIKGLGFKEASHFLRNIGYKNLAIVDRHIINLLVENKLLKEKPKTITKKLYLNIEKILLRLCDKLNMSQAELDMYMWYLKTGEVLK